MLAVARAQEVNRQLAQQLARRRNSRRSSHRPQRSRLWSRRLDRRSAPVVSRRRPLLRRAADASRGELRQVALYDLGNLYLKEALRVRESGADASALPLLELAKESLSQRAAGASDLWDAKFNLELALRLAPDPDRTTPALRRS